MDTIRHMPSGTFPPPVPSNSAPTKSECKKSISIHSTSDNNRSRREISGRSRDNSSFSLYQRNSNSNNTIWQLTVVVLLGMLCRAALANPVFVDNPSLAQFQSGRNIRHLPCIVRKSGRSGVCMFAIDCIKQNGTHLGTCIDRFYFGSCCQLTEESLPEISDNSIDQNTISHFVHESTTLPTSALFKNPTESQTRPQHDSPSSTVGIGSSSHTSPHKNVTQSFTSTTAIGKPIKHAPSKRPPVHTTHKTSQFVVRTTMKPTTVSKTTLAPTTVKPPRRKTTVPAPVLTTQASKLPTPETTTLPQKIFTFQIVETTTPTPTEATKTDELITTTFRPFYTTRRTKPPVSSLVTKDKTSITTTVVPVTTNFVTTTMRPTPPVRNTHRPKPTVQKRPTTTPTLSTQKVTQSKRPTGKPTRKPTVTATVEKVRPPLINTTATHTSTSTTHRKPPLTTTTVGQPPTFGSTQTQQTTRAPRPKPKPTAEIVKVPKPTTIAEARPETLTPLHTTTTTRPTKRPITQSSSTSAPKTSSTTTTAATSTTTTTTTTSTTRKPIFSTTQAPTLTTEAPKVERPIMTTMKPGLVTWTDVEAEPVTNTSDEWLPHPPASDWVPVPTIVPDTSNKTITHTSPVPPMPSSTEKIIVSISSSISEVMSNVSSIMPKPERPSTITSTSTTSTTTTTTSRPKPSTTTTPSTTSTTPISSTTTTSTTTTTAEPITVPPKTTEAPFDFNATTTPAGVDWTTEAGTGTGTGSSTTEYTTEDFNATMVDMTTVAPVNLLEGMDYRQVCGRRMFPEPRIVGGSNAAFGRWPWQISLRQWRTSTYLHKCGAALLNENWAITAAHCVDNVPPSDLLLRLGEYDLAEEEEPYPYQERRVQIVASHPQFDPRTFEYDLALLRFYEPVPFQPNIIPVCVPNNDRDFIGQTAFVTGWGRLYEDGPLPSVLQEVAVPVINNTICETMYRAAGYIEHIPHIFICAGWKKGGYDSCEGDSGGPMVLQREEDKRFQLGGVISWGIGCAEPNQPGVYTRISEFRDWINQILQF